MFDRLLDEPEVKPIGLGARDSLRLEAGLCLYGHDIDETTSPVEAALAWSIGKRRRTEGGFPGAARVQRELADGPSRAPRRHPARGTRAGARGRTDPDARTAMRSGVITSGGFGPTVERPIAMGYVDSKHAAPETAIAVVVRDKPLAASVSPLPFVPHRYHRQKGTP